MNRLNGAAADDILRRHQLEPEGYICVVPRFRYTLNNWLLKGVRGAPEDDERWVYSSRYAEPDHAKLRDVIVRWVRETGLKVLLTPELRYNPEMFEEYLYDPLSAESQPEVSTVIPGAKTINELEQCVRGADAVLFDQTTMADVRAIQRAWGDWKVYG